MLVCDGSGYDSGEVSHAVLLELRRSAERHPAVRQARGYPSSVFTRVRADLDPRVLGGTSSEGTLTIRWFAGETREERPEFSFHYSDGSGFDNGWHFEPNPHVDGWAHFQQRESAADDYEYRQILFGSEQPVRVLWEVFDRLESVLSTR